ncbi:SMI1/KNR4 family protein [Streptomyces chattanoogensis]|uniref:Cell wall assembly/cell proliferation coordinating protein, KNR4 n=1 Tax=Streptomyces chattanoogensis TaxID=66876 RepID=A0A0N1JWL0_9ACTN|nr:SMI1/KNR4 family protein [Streptomyces chattanoogensis]KPC60456.1 cell wall assembly/cell proliferation coordinating protein, KNR4 [Streptomyces chattanoogensis]
MWRDLVGRAYAGAGFRTPAGPAGLSAAERRLGCPLPAELAGLLRETDGVAGPYGVDTVWPLERIVEQNLHFWKDRSFAGLYMPFDALLFFGDNGGGDQFAFVRTPPRADVFVWEHEDDSRRWVARDLRDYLGRSLAEGGDDWYQCGRR